MPINCNEVSDLTERKNKQVCDEIDRMMLWIDFYKDMARDFTDHQEFYTRKAADIKEQITAVIRQAKK